MKVNGTKIPVTWVSAAGWSYQCGIERSLELYCEKTMGAFITDCDTYVPLLPLL